MCAKVHRMVGDLSDVEPSLPDLMPALSAPSPAASAPSDAPLVAQRSLAATDVKIKKKTRVPAAKPAKSKSQANSIQTKRSPAGATPLPSNAAKLLKHLRGVLSTKGFASVNQSAVSKATGIPLGSMTASLKRLVAAGHVQANHTGMFKLA